MSILDALGGRSNKLGRWQELLQGLLPTTRTLKTWGV